MVVGNGNVSAGVNRIATVARHPTRELVVGILRIIKVALIRKHNNGLLADNNVVVDGIAIGILHHNARRLEDRLVAHIAAFVAHPHNNRLHVYQIIVERVLVDGSADNLPVVFSRRRVHVVGHPISRYAGAAVILDERDAVIIDAHASVGQRDSGHVFGSIGALDIGLLLIEEDREESLRCLGFVALLIFDSQFENPFSRRTLVGKAVRSDGLGIGLPAAVINRLVLRVVNLATPLSNRAICASKGSGLRLIHKVDRNALSISKMLLVHRHQLIARLVVNEVEVRQRQLRLNRCLVELLAFDVVFIDVLGHLGDIVIFHGDKAIVSTQTLMGDVARVVFDGVSNDVAVLSVRDIEDLVFVHAVDAVLVGRAFLIGNVGVVRAAHQIDEVLLLGTLIILGSLQSIESRSLVAHFKIGIHNSRKGTAAMGRVANPRTEAVKCLAAVELRERHVPKCGMEFRQIAGSIIRLRLHRH